MNASFKNFDLTGKTAYITGGGTGLGYVMARGLSRLGATVMMAARREDVLRERANALSAETGNKVLYATIDLSNPGNIAASAERAIATLKGVDIFIGNAGQDGLELIDRTTEAVVDDLFQVNVQSNISLVRLFLPHMRSKKWGRVLFSSSFTTRRGSPHEGFGAYAATKNGLNAFARVAACEAGHDGITFNSLILGTYMTDIMRGVIAGIDKEHGAGAGQAFLNTVASMTALGRLGQPDEVESIVQLLASDAGSYITGAEIPIDGGMSITMKPNMPSQ